MSAVVGLLFPAILATIAVVALGTVLYSHATIRQLADVPMMQDYTGPRVSIIVAARDEERHIRAAVAALMAQDYHDVEVIVVNDRSVDRTAKILNAMAAKAPRLAVVHVQELPEGWLGKNHALHVGAQRATGELLLFIDGDVLLHRSALSRAVRLFEEPGADHVTVAPQLDLPSLLLQLVVGFFVTWGTFAGRVWQVENMKRSASIGIGAFNLVRASKYKEVGGHARIPMRPDDDLMLGKILKQAGGQPRVRFGRDMVGVEWYRDLKEATLGFRKNAFTVLHYSVPLFLLAATGTVLLCVSPWVLVWVTEGTPQVLYGITIAALMAGYARSIASQKLPQWLTLFYPVAAILEISIVVIAVTRTLRAGGIDWRGTFYPLDKLRANRV